jgi:CubicO group peptidase (beta-lactamase class C family)
MIFSRVQFLVGRSVAAALLIVSMVACQDAEKTEQVKQQRIAEEERQQIEVPAYFTADSAAKLGSYLDSIFTRLHNRNGFNGTVLVTKYDQVLYKGAFGYSDFSRKDTLTTQTAFQLASVSKQFTAMAIMMLKEKGKLAYDDSVQQHLPDFPYHGITIRQLLTHRSGLGNYTYFSDELWPDRNKPITNQDVLQLMSTYQPPIYFQPDSHFNYSNTGYMVLASIVAKASGMPYATFLQKRIFGPLKMKNTFTYSKNVATLTGKVATGHTGGRRKRSPDYLDTVLGDKGIYSTVEDLYKWDQALYTGKLVKQETLEEAFIGSRKKKRDEDYGFGWRIKTVTSGDTIVYHGGLWHGYATYLLRNPKDHSALIVLSNVPNGSFRHLKEIQKFLYPEQPKMVANVRKQSKAAGNQL